tara:strand:- start:609 stop:848 length:240 start_codon:yes stop_codon:yes gene_type:complete
MNGDTEKEMKNNNWGVQRPIISKSSVISSFRTSGSHKDDDIITRTKNRLYVDQVLQRDKERIAREIEKSELELARDLFS